MSGPSKNRHALAILGALLLTTGAARAEPPRIEASGDVEGCPSADELRRAIATQLGRDDFDRAGAPLVVVRVRRREGAGASLAADVSMTTTQGRTSSRTIADGDGCGELVRAAALTIALALESESAAEETPAPPLQAPPPPPPPPREEPTSRHEPVRSDRIAITASALTSVGLLPRPAAGVGAAGRVRVADSVWISARGFWLPEAAMPNDAFAMRLIAAGAGACVEPFGTTNVAAVGCGHVMAGAFGVTKADVSMQSRAAEAYVAATLSAGARARVIGPLHLEAAVDAQVPFTRPTYLTAACPPTGFEPPFAAVALWLGAGASLR